MKVQLGAILPFLFLVLLYARMLKRSGAIRRAASRLLFGRDDNCE